MIQNHTFVQVSDIHKTLNKNRKLTMDLLKLRKDFPSAMFSQANIMVSLERLSKRKVLFVYCEQGDFVEVRNSGTNIPDWDTLRIYLYNVYLTEAMFVKSIYHVSQNAETRRNDATDPFLTRNIPTDLINIICSEQRAVLENIGRRPVINLFGPGGSGKTFAFKILFELFKNEVLFLAWQNRAAIGVYEILGKESRCSTMHKILSRHKYYCTKTVNDFFQTDYIDIRACWNRTTKIE